jgi:hypothetical protein
MRPTKAQGTDGKVIKQALIKNSEPRIKLIEQMTWIYMPHLSIQIRFLRNRHLDSSEQVVYPA